LSLFRPFSPPSILVWAEAAAVRFAKPVGAVSKTVPSPPDRSRALFYTFFDGTGLVLPHPVQGAIALFFSTSLGQGSLRKWMESFSRRGVPCTSVFLHPFSMRAGLGSRARYSFLFVRCWQGSRFPFTGPNDDPGDHRLFPVLRVSRRGLAPQGSASTRC